MNPRTHDFIVWDGFPHPDPVMRHASVSVQIAPPFWRRVLRHLNSQAAAWEAWLTSGGAAALRESLECQTGPANFAGERSLWPADVIERLRATFCASFWQPLVIQFGDTIAPPGGYYQLILTSGAIAVLRSHPSDPALLLLEDCFFTADHPSRETGDDDMFRRSVVGRMVNRYGVFDEPGDRFLLPGADVEANSGRVRFLWPRLWDVGRSSWKWTSDTKRAEAIGLERLFGRHPSDPSRPILSESSAASAARELRMTLHASAHAAAHLPLHFHTASEAYREEVCLSLLESRLSAWAAFVAIDEAYAAALDQGSPSSELSENVDAVLAAIEAFDDVMHSTEPFWSSVAARTELTRNWIRHLTPPHRESPPWWMIAALRPSAPASASSYCLG